MAFQNTTLCYIEKDDDILFVVKGGKGDLNDGKYLGVGGHVEKGESPRECIVREIYEETGLFEKDIDDLRLSGIVTFTNTECEDEYMYVFRAYYIGTGDPCNDHKDADGEGQLVWIPRGNIRSLPIWEGDRIMFDLMFRNGPFFMLKLEYEGDVLKAYKIEK